MSSSSSSLPNVYIPFDDDKENDTKKKPCWNQQLRSFRIMAAPYFHECWYSKWMLASLLLLALLSSAIRVVFSYLMRDFWSALAEQEPEEFYSVLYKFLIALLVLVPIHVLYRFQRQRLAIFWREWMTERTLELYYKNRVYYILSQEQQQQQTTMDNVDQRIQEDVRSFTGFSLSFFLIVVNSLIDLVAFSVILYSIRPQLFLAIVGFAFLGSVATWLIGRQLILLNFEKLKREATFRFSLVRTRENAEQIAFWRGEQTEVAFVTNKFDNVIVNMHDINVAERNLDFFTTLYNYTTWVLPVVVVAPEYFAGNVELGIVQQAANAFSHVLEDVSLIINQFESLSEFAAGIDRLYQFYVAVQKADVDRDDSNNESSALLKVQDSDKSGDQKDALENKTSSSNRTIELFQMEPPLQDQHNASLSQQHALVVQNLSLETPDGQRTLFRSLSFSIEWTKSLLVVGPSGIGKSSLLRAVAGLWTNGSGRITRPHDLDIFFLPQRPYCALGSLRQQLLYPHVHSNISDQDLLNVLQRVNLYQVAIQSGGGNALAGLNTSMDWSHTLSLGEQQRLSFARILIYKPSLVVLDESTSALDVESERNMYDLLKSNNIAYISVGHRPSLQAHHTTKLTFRGVQDSVLEELNV